MSGNLCHVQSGLGNREFVQSVVQNTIAMSGLYPLATGEGIEVMERRQGERALLFLLNHSDAPQTVTVPNTCCDSLTDAVLQGNIELQPDQVRILTEVRQESYIHSP